MNDLLLEIGTEEIPSGYIEPALAALSEKLLKALDDARIAHGPSDTFGTPRRLAIIVRDVAAMQPSLTTEVSGPPEKAGFDKDGNPTMAAVKFAEKLGITVQDITVIETKKGRYLSAVKTEKGLPSRTLLASIIPDVTLSIPFPKTMRWSDLTIHFARPIRSIAAVLGKQVVSFSMGGLKSGRHVSGHRFMKPCRISIAEPASYTGLLKKACVLADIQERKERVIKEITVAAEKAGGTVLKDDELVTIVTHLVECPYAVTGTFDKKFLELPGEILITAMREHQKYFAVTDKKGNLMPCFIAVNNTKAKKMSLVAKGHERVLRARLEDAMFFYKNDLETSFETYVEKLKGVLFQAQLGTVYEKVLRVQKLVEFLVEKAGREPIIKGHVLRAAWLCKADLVSSVVIEFPKLQGVMGKVYAAYSNESPEVASAIEEHYRPTSSGARLPETDTGALLGIADKIDSICGCFSVGLIPTGASDPYALRRQAIGIAQIMLDKGYAFPLTAMIEKSLHLFGNTSGDETRRVTADVYTFLQNRIAYLLAEEGFSKDIIAAVASVSVDNIPDVWKRVKALDKLRHEPDFEPLAVAFKRVVNIIKKADQQQMKTVSRDLFQDACESVLFDALHTVKGNVAGHLNGGDVERALHEIATLRNPVDAFFEGVMIMADDTAIRENRLALLNGIAGLFANIADFSKITT